MCLFRSESERKNEYINSFPKKKDKGNLMPNHVNVTLTIEANPEKTDLIKQFFVDKLRDTDPRSGLRGVGDPEGDFAPKMIDGDYFIRANNIRVSVFSYITRWRPPRVKTINLMFGNDQVDEDFFDDVKIRCAWSETGLLGYGWWSYVEGHTEKHIFETSSIEYDDDDEEDGTPVPTGAYKEFLIRERVDA
jgi:hypothetical protein